MGFIAVAFVGALQVSTVKQADGSTLKVEPALALGAKVEVFTRSRLIRIPLTDKVTYVQRDFVARGTVTRSTNRGSEVTVTYLSPGAEIRPGMEVAQAGKGGPGPATRSPGTVRLRAGRTSAEAGQEIVVEADPLDAVFAWSCTGGALSARRTVSPRVSWVAPGKPGDYEVRVSADGSAGAIGLVSTGVGKSLKTKEFVLAAKLDFSPRKYVHAGFDPDGRMLALDATRRTVVAVEAGSGAKEWQLPPSAQSRLRAPVACEWSLEGLLVLDGKKPFLKLYDGEGNFSRAFGEGGLSRPSGMAVAATGSVYIADPGKRCVHLFEPDGKYRFPVGLGRGQLSFGRPVAVACDSSGLVYVLDSTQGEVKIFGSDFRSTGSVPLGEGGSDVAVSPDGSRIYVLYAAPAGLSCYGRDGRKLFDSTQEGVFESLPAKPARLAMDRFRMLYVFPQGGGEVRRYDPDGKAAGVLGAAKKLSPVALAVSGEGKVLLAGKTLAVCRLPAWVLKEPASGKGTAGVRPSDCAVTGTGELAVASTKTRSVSIFSAAGEYMREMGGKGAWKDATDVEADDEGRVWVLDGPSFKVHVAMAATGGGKAIALKRGMGAGKLGHADALAVEPQTGRFYVFDVSTAQIKLYTKEGKFVASAGKFLRVKEMVADGFGFLWVLDPAGFVRRVYFGRSGAEDCGVLQVQAADIAVDGRGSLYVLTQRGEVHVFR